MKCAIPVDTNQGENSIVGQHFGKVPYYAIWDSETEKLEIIENMSNHRGGVGLPMEFLAKICNVVICKGIGAKAVSLGNQFGLQIFMGATGRVKDTISLFKEGKLYEATKDDGCQH